MSHLSRLLFAIESGHASQFVGKKLADIDVSGSLLSTATLSVFQYVLKKLITLWLNYWLGLF